MNTLLLVVGLVVGLAGTVQAAEREGLIEAIGGFQTADGVVLGSAAEIVAVSHTCSASACTIGLYNGDELGDATAANGRHEQRAAANDSKFTEFENPIRFTTGIVLDVDSNVASVTVYRRVITP